MTNNPSFSTNARLDALNTILASDKRYRAFVACAEAKGHQWATDADLEAFEAKVAATLQWDVALPEWGHLWIIAAQQVLDGRLCWLSKQPEPELALMPALEFPHVEGDAATYFPDEPFDEGGEL